MSSLIKGFQNIYLQNQKKNTQNFYASFFYCTKKKTSEGQKTKIKMNCNANSGNDLSDSSKWAIVLEIVRLNRSC